MTDIRGIIHIAKKGACQLTHLPAELPLAKRPDSGTSLPENTTRERKNKIFRFTTTYEIHYRIWRTSITEFGGLLLPNLAKKHVKVAKINENPPPRDCTLGGEIDYLIHVQRELSQVFMSSKLSNLLPFPLAISLSALSNLAKNSSFDICIESSFRFAILRR